ncbi:MAG: hypothetical protein LBR61_06985 [Synergistaceae bacterium]|jgi:YD repeat-containing protein|nr:hypothetical protein [Synergistaceae bacterium]
MPRVKEMVTALYVLLLIWATGEARADWLCALDIADKPEIILKTLNLKGHVKSVREENFRKNNSEEIPVSWVSSIFPEISLFPDWRPEVSEKMSGVILEACFDEAGRITFFKNWTHSLPQKGDGSFSMLYFWDGEGRLQRIVCPEQNVEKICFWDERSNLLKGTMNVGGQQYRKAEMEFDESRRCVKVTQYIFEGVDGGKNGKEPGIFVTFSLRYTPEGYIAREEKTMGANVFVRDYCYNEKGQVVKKRSFVESRPDGDSGDVLYVWYDSSGRRTESRYESLDGKTVYIRQCWTYDAAGRLGAWETYYDNGVTVEKGTCDYDDEGKLVRILRANGSDEFRYDDQGNWTERVTQVGDVSTIITRRVFAYYP